MLEIEYTDDHLEVSYKAPQFGVVDQYSVNFVFLSEPYHIKFYFSQYIQYRTYSRMGAVSDFTAVKSNYFIIAGEPKNTLFLLN